MGFLVVSDLDGTLLDHHTYSYEPALPALQELKRQGVSLVLCSSKTRAEMIPLWQELGLGTPLITENGGGVFCPWPTSLPLGEAWRDAGSAWRIYSLGLGIDELRRRFSRFKDEFQARGFGDLSDEEVAGLTGLSLQQANAARKREFNEPVVLPDEEAREASFREAAREQGLQVTKGGRFLHLLGGGDKGKAVQLVVSLYRTLDQDLTTMGLGDAPNDLSLLEVVDFPVMVARPDGTHAALNLPGLERQPFPGPLGWNQAVLARLRCWEEEHA